MSTPASVLIIGGGIAGWTAASGLRKGGFEGEVTVVEAEELSYDRPPLSKEALEGGASMASLAFASAEDLAAQRIELLAGTPAVGIGPGEATLADGRRLTAEHVLVATGAPVRRPDFPGADSERVATLRRYADLERIRAAAVPGARIVVLGGGFIGAEAAASLRTLGVEVTLVDRNEVPGTRMLGATLAGWLHGLHAVHGVETRVAGVAGVTDPGDGAPLVVRLDSGEELPADLLLAGIGMAEPVPLPGVEHADTVLPARPHWDAARIDGRDAATAILGQPPKGPTADWFWSDRYGLHLEVVGRLVGPGEEIVRWAEPGRPAAILRLDGGRLVGAASVDDANTVRAARRLIDRGIAVTAEQLADPAIGLRELLPPSS